MITPRHAIASLPLAHHGGRRALIGVDVLHDFSVCLNAFGPADVIRAAIRDAAIDEYPDPASTNARAVAAETWGLHIDCVSLGAGAAELIQATCLAFCETDDLVLIEAPAFGEYSRAAAIAGARSRFATRAALLEAIAETRPRLIFVCSPSNPLGEARSRDELVEIADAARGVGALLVIDQAYDAFIESPIGPTSFSDEPLVLSIRSMTKEHAIPGVRVAFAIGSADVIRTIERARVPWSASVVVQAAAIACLSSEATSHARESIGRLRSEARRIRDALGAGGFSLSSSDTHFFTVDVGNASAVARKLLATSKIYVRDCTSFGLPAAIRVAARTPSENDALLRSLDPLSARIHA